MSISVVDKRSAWNQNNKTPGRSANIDHIVIHGMATTSPNAVPAVWNTRQASAHYGVKNGSVEMYVSPTDTAWHAGNWSMNCRSIGVEHLNSDAANNFSDETINTSVQFVSGLMKQYNIPIENVIRHKDVVATACPQALGNEPLWTEYKNRLLSSLGSAQAPTVPTPAAPAPAPASATNNINLISQNGTFRSSVNSLIIHWDEPNFGNNNASGSYLNVGNSVAYDSYVDIVNKSNGKTYRFISYIGNSGHRCYVARRTLDNTEIFGVCY